MQPTNEVKLIIFIALTLLQIWVPIKLSYCGDLVKPQDFVDREITIRCAHGDEVSYPLMQIKITLTGGHEFVVQAAVSKSLPVSALLGWDIPQLTDLITPPQPMDALAAVTSSHKTITEKNSSPTPDSVSADD